MSSPAAAGAAPSTASCVADTAWHSENLREEAVPEALVSARPAPPAPAWGTWRAVDLSGAHGLDRHDLTAALRKLLGDSRRARACERLDISVRAWAGSSSAACPSPPAPCAVAAGTCRHAQFRSTWRAARTTAARQAVPGHDAESNTVYCYIERHALYIASRYIGTLYRGPI